MFDFPLTGINAIKHIIATINFFYRKAIKQSLYPTQRLTKLLSTILYSMPNQRSLSKLNQTTLPRSFVSFGYTITLKDFFIS